jgi:hypothetical protein
VAQHGPDGVRALLITVAIATSIALVAVGSDGL